MKEEHILDILDKQKFDELSRAEFALIESHAAECSNCSIAYKSARVSAELLKTSVLHNFEPSPFFAKRVLANLRDKELVKTPFFAIGRLWRATGSLVALMITTILVLLATTMLAPGSMASENDSAEMFILDQKLPNRDLNEQLFQDIYGVNKDK